MAPTHDRSRIRKEMRALIPRAKDLDTKEGAGARLLFHRLAVELRLESSVPPWVIEKAREQGVLT